MSNIRIKTFLHEDFVNYKKPSMFIAFPYCTFKCGKEHCQNKDLINQPDIEIEAEQLVSLYLKNDITKALVIGGLEPFDSFKELLFLVETVRMHTDDDIVIYSGYTEEELEPHLKSLKQWDNIIIKFGRYVPILDSVYDDILGVTLSSSNQYAKNIGDL